MLALAVPAHVITTTADAVSRVSRRKRGVALDAARDRFRARLLDQGHDPVDAAQFARSFRAAVVLRVAARGDV